jgi:hypothetical protein
MFDNLATDNATAPGDFTLSTRDTFATVRDAGRPIGTVERPRAYGDAPTDARARDLFRVYLEGRLVAVFVIAPTLIQVRRALLKAVKASPSVEGRTVSELEAIRAENTRLVSVNSNAFATFKTPAFRASALSRVFYHESVAALAAERLATLKAARVEGVADNAAELARVIVRASTPALELIALRLALRLAMATGGERESVGRRLRLVAAALVARRTAPAGCELAPVRPATYDAPRALEVAA